MKPIAASAILVNKKNEILMLLRDDKEGLLYPNCWSIIGGECEPNEKPIDAIKRESLEEIGDVPERLNFFMTMETPYHVEHVYWSFFDKDINVLKCGEGQCLKYVPFEQISEKRAAFNCDVICSLFFRYIGKFREG